MANKETLAYIALNSVNGLGPVKIKHLTEAFGTAQKVFDTSPEELEKFISRKCIEQLHSGAIFDYAQKQLELCHECGCKILTPADNSYPSYLKEIYAPPPVLFVQGEISVFNSVAVAIVGTRNPTHYGKCVTQQLSRELIERNIVIVSGLALGIDTIAHQSCIEHKGKTIAVLGCGIDQIYPKSNAELASAITRVGALVSEFPMGTPPEAFNFPRRNRIISGCSCATVVVEAGEKSGSLITAHYALQQGRDIYAVPGSIYSPMSAGTFNLIRQGAIPVRDGFSIAEALKSQYAPMLNLDLPESAKKPLHLLSETEKHIYDILSCDPMRIDTIIQLTGKSLNELFATLLNLELKGFIRQLSGQQFVREF